MGQCMSKQETAIKEVEAPATKLSGETTASEKPKPMIFARMRNGHEVIRGAQRDMRKTLESGDLDKFAKECSDFGKWEAEHARMEEGCGQDTTPRGFFRLLDTHCDNVATENNLFSAHEDIHTVTDSVEAALKSKDLNAVQSTYESFCTKNEEHLKHEEEIMMPMVKKLMQSGHPMKQYMKEEILANVQDMEFFIKFAVGTLEHHSQEMPRFRVFAHALWAVATPKEWRTWNEWIQSTVTAETYAQLQAVL